MAEKTTLDWIALVLLIVGGLNWGLVAMNFNLVSTLFGDTVVTTIVYALVGLSALYTIYFLSKK